MVSPIYPGGAYPVGAVPYGKKADPESVPASGQHYDQIQFSSQLSETEKRSPGRSVPDSPVRIWRLCGSRWPPVPTR